MNGQGILNDFFSAFLKCIDDLSDKYCHQVPLCHHPFKPLLTILQNLICYKLNYVKRKLIEKDQEKEYMKILTMLIFD